MIAILRLFTIAYLISLAPMGWAAEGSASVEVPTLEQTDPVALSVVAEDQVIAPGATTWVALHVKVQPHWHTYWKNPGDAGMPLTVTWSLPEGFTVGEILWPTPQRFTLESAVGFGYEDDVVLLAQVTVPQYFKSGSSQLGASVRWVACNEETCVPGESKGEVSLVAGPATKKSEADAPLFLEARKLVPQQGGGLSVTRKDSFIEISVPQELADDAVTAAEFFPEIAMDFDIHEAQEWQPCSKSSQGKLLLNDNGDATICRGIVVLHSSRGDVSCVVDAKLPPAHDDDMISMSEGSHKALKTSTKGSTAAAMVVPGEFDFRGGVILAVALAFLGGMILNLMPCVLPVISFKVLGFIKLAGQNRAVIFNHGLAFCFGVLLSFWVLAGALLVLQSYGKAVGWGFQLQEPMFVMVLASLVFIFALSLFGVFEMGSSLIGMAGRAGANNSNRNELVSSFLSGILATAVATPCTGPFLGSAVGFAVTLPPMEAMAIFTAIGLGMSFPYMALAAFPSLLKYMPKPGAWMETFKQIMGFMMVATAIWLLWVFGAQTGSLAMALLLVAFLVFAVAAWIYGRWGSPVRSPRTRFIGQLVAAGLLGLGAYTAYVSATPWAEAMGGVAVEETAQSKAIASAWEEFSPERVAELRSKGTPVFIDFTAKWCLICQANHMVLVGEEVSKEFAARGVVRMKADWTKRDDIIAAELKKLGRNSVPLYVLYGTDAEEAPQILPQFLTKDNVTDALKQID
jgi:thiol:disulfide interchange protein DsbD